MTVSIPIDELRVEVSRLLAIFYDKRVAALTKLELRKVLARKNPYLYRAISAGDAATIVEELLRARISSADETMFGNEFFEPLAIWVAEHANADDSAINARISSAAGVDVEVEFSSKFMAIAVKSGTSVFNAQSRAKQKDQFEQARSRLFKNGKQFDPVVGYSYGRLSSKETAFRELAGESFWAELSGEPDFYLEIVEAMAQASTAHAAMFKVEYDKALNRFTRDLLLEFSDADGQLDWVKLVKFNSAATAPPRAANTTIPAP